MFLLCSASSYPLFVLDPPHIKATPDGCGSLIRRRTPLQKRSKKLVIGGKTTLLPITTIWIGHGFIPSPFPQQCCNPSPPKRLEPITLFSPILGGGKVAGGERGNITFQLHCSSEASAHCNLKVHHLPLQRNTHLNLFSHDLGTARILRTMANQSAHRHL